MTPIPTSIVKMVQNRNPELVEIAKEAKKSLTDDLETYFDDPCGLAVLVVSLPYFVEFRYYFEQGELFAELEDLPLNGCVRICSSPNSDDYLFVFWKGDDVAILANSPAPNIDHALFTQVMQHITGNTMDVEASCFPKRKWTGDRAAIEPLIAEIATVAYATMPWESCVDMVYNFLVRLNAFCQVLELYLLNKFTENDVHNLAIAAPAGLETFISRRLRFLERVIHGHTSSNDSNPIASPEISKKRSAPEPKPAPVAEAEVSESSSSISTSESEEEAPAAPVAAAEEPEEEEESEDSDPEDPLDGRKLGLNRQTMVHRSREFWKSGTDHCWFCRVNVVKIDERKFKHFNGTVICARCASWITKSNILKDSPSKNPKSCFLTFDYEAEVKFTQAEVNEGRGSSSKPCGVCLRTDWYHKRKFCDSLALSPNCILCETKMAHIRDAFKENKDEIPGFTEVAHKNKLIAYKCFERLATKLKLRDPVKLFKEQFPSCVEALDKLLFGTEPEKPAETITKKTKATPAKSAKSTAKKSTKSTAEKSTKATVEKSTKSTVEKSSKSKVGKSTKAVVVTKSASPTKKMKPTVEPSPKKPVESVPAKPVTTPKQPVTTPKQPVATPGKMVFKYSDIVVVEDEEPKSKSKSRRPAKESAPKRRKSTHAKSPKSTQDLLDDEGELEFESQDVDDLGSNEEEEEPRKISLRETTPTPRSKPHPAKMPVASVVDTREKPTEKQGNRLVFEDRRVSQTDPLQCSLEDLQKLFELIFANLDPLPHRSLIHSIEDSFLTLSGNIDLLKKMEKENPWVSTFGGFWGLGWWIMKLGKLTRVMCDSTYDTPFFMRRHQTSIGELRTTTNSGTKEVIGIKNIKNRLDQLNKAINTIAKDAQQSLLGYLFQLI